MRKTCILFSFILFSISFSLISLAMPKSETDSKLYPPPENPLDQQINEFKKIENKSPFQNLRLSNLITEKQEASKNIAQLTTKETQQFHVNNIYLHINESKSDMSESYFAYYFFNITRAGKLLFAEKYMGEKNKTTHRERHTQLSNFKSLRAAGEVIIKKGEVIVTNRSDEYKCTLDENFKSLVRDKFSEKNIPVNDIVSFDSDKASNYLQTPNKQATLVNQLRNSPLLTGRKNQH